MIPRYEVDFDGRALLAIHKVQTNHDFNDPFKSKTFVAKPTCGLKLDCVISKQSLKDIGVQSTRREHGWRSQHMDARWIFPVALKYDNKARNTTCHLW
jgi:hypothetical protein